MGKPEFTVLGASGFVGSCLVKQLKDTGTSVFAPKRADSTIMERPLGHVIYCVGYTADFRSHPLETAEAHVGYLVDLLRNAEFDSLLYLSSTRVYEGAGDTDESSKLQVDPLDPNHIFNLTKLAGEACCLSQRNPAIRIARLSNVVGDDFTSENFVYSVLREALSRGKVEIRTSADSAKDYVWIHDVVRILPEIAKNGGQRVYNVASGQNVSNAEFAEAVRVATGAAVSFSSSATKVTFPRIKISRLSEELGYQPRNVLGELGELAGRFRTHLSGGK